MSTVLLYLVDGAQLGPCVGYQGAFGTRQGSFSFLVIRGNEYLPHACAESVICAVGGRLPDQKSVEHPHQAAHCVLVVFHLHLACTQTLEH